MFVEAKGNLHIDFHLIFSLGQEFLTFTATHTRLFMSAGVTVVCYLPPLVWWSFWGSERRSSPCMADALTHLSPQPTCLVLGKIVVKLAHDISSLTVPRRIKQTLFGGLIIHGLPRSCLLCAWCTWFILDLSPPVGPEQITFSCVFIWQFSCVPAL